MVEATVATRSTTTKPPPKKAAKPPPVATRRYAIRASSVVPNGSNGQSSKRAPSPDRRSPSPAAKRRRPNMRPPAATILAASNIFKTRGQTLPIPAMPALAQLKPYLNPLPTPPPQIRPALQLFVWGLGADGQLGRGPESLQEVSKPQRNIWVEQKIEEGAFGDVGAGIETVACGGFYSLFVDEKGVVWSCGNNDSAGLGRVTENVPDPGDLDKSLDPDLLTTIPHPIRSLIDVNFRAVQVVAGNNISAAVSDQGELRIWGSFRDEQGTVNFAEGLTHQFLPVPLLHLSHKPGDTERVSNVAAGDDHIIVLTTHGNIYTWGFGAKGQLGRKIIERRKIDGTVPEKITLGIRGRKAIAVGAGMAHSFAVDQHGDVWAWGLDNHGQTGTESSSDDDIIHLPTRIPRLSMEKLDGDQVVQIAAGEHHTLFRTTAGRVYACGRAEGGQLGLAHDDPVFQGQANAPSLAEPSLITFPDMDDPITHISAGPHFNMACSAAGALYSWGQGPQSELGVGDMKISEVRTPRIIVRKAGGSFAAVSTSCGGQHTLGLFRKRTTG